MVFMTQFQNWMYAQYLTLTPEERQEWRDGGVSAQGDEMMEGEEAMDEEAELFSL